MGIKLIKRWVYLDEQAFVAFLHEYPIRRIKLSTPMLTGLLHLCIDLSFVQIDNTTFLKTLLTTFSLSKIVCHIIQMEHVLL